MDISVIIPTYNREEYLSECLDVLMKQNFSRKYEIIIVNDGSTQEYRFLENYDNKQVIIYVKKSHNGPASAKNYGINLAKGKFIIFIGDDIICTTDFIRNHYDFLIKNDKTISAGKTVWHNDTPNKELFWLLQYTGLGNFSTENKDDCGFYAFTTSNIGIARLYLNKERFDENFPYPALEDNELGLRLYKQGLKIKYNEKALAYHKHAYTMDVIKIRQWELGYSLGYFINKRPEVKKVFLRPQIVILLARILQTKLFFFLGPLNMLMVCLCIKQQGIKDFS